MQSKMKNRINGFTLIEILIAVILLGIGIAAIIGSNGAFMQASETTAHLSTADFLISQIRELTAIIPASSSDPNILDVYYFDDANYCPPIDSQQNPLTDFSDYRQLITIFSVNGSDFETEDAGGDFMRIEVEIKYKNSSIAQTSWIRSKDF